MGESTAGLYFFLRLGFVYELSQRCVRSWNSRQRFVESILRPQKGDRILDIGCGIGSILEHLPEVDYIGVDANEHYIAMARRKFGSRGNFKVGDAGQLERMPQEEFDLVIALGVMHHCEDEIVSQMLRQASRLLRPRGRFVSHDPVYVAGQSWASRFFVGLDRGRHVRSANGIVELVRPYFHEVEERVVHDSLRIPFSEIILQCRVA